MSAFENEYPSVMALCERHHSIERRQEEIHKLLGELETMLADRHRWFELTRVQRRVLPAAQQFYDLEDELEQLGEESAKLVVDLSHLTASTLAEAVAKLKVVACVIDPDDYPTAHRVLVSLTNEVLVLSGR